MVCDMYGLRRLATCSLGHAASETSIKLVFHLTYTMMHLSTKLKL